MMLVPHCYMEAEETKPWNKLICMSQEVAESELKVKAHGPPQGHLSFDGQGFV